MAKAFVAIVAGTISAFIVILLVELIGSIVAPAGVAPAPGDAVAMKAYLDTLPARAYAFVIGAYLIGSFAGGTVAARVAGHRSSICGWVVGMLVLAATIGNLVMIPHPAWFVVAAILAVIIGTTAATRFVTLGARSDPGL